MRHCSKIRIGTSSRPRPRRQSPRAGVAMIEATGILFLLILLLVGIMEVSRALMAYNLLTRAVREGARLAAIKPDLVKGDGQVIGRIDKLVTDGGVKLASSTVDFIGPKPQVLRGAMFRVSAQADFIPAVSTLVFTEKAAGIPLQAQVIARHE